ncbi:MAG: hypothetical protein MUC43_06785 [Pirellula sp.]|jgi:hypothetical protein|nr:hypothetical protein [Pirellula sp.]
MTTSTTPEDKTKQFVEILSGTPDSKSLVRIRNEKADDKIRDAIRMTPGVQPFKHNYYTSEQFYQRDRQRGIITNVYGQRVLRVTEDFITGVLGGLEDEVGEKAGMVMYETGYAWGMEDMRNFVKRSQGEFEVDFTKMGMGMMLETWWWPLTIEGWGTWQFDFREAKRDMLFIELYESAVAKTLGDIGAVVCYFYAGLFSAVFSVLSRKDFGCVEIQCYAMGADHCKFLISHAERVNAAAFWRSQGATGKDIMKKVKNA